MVVEGGGGRGSDVPTSVEWEVAPPCSLPETARRRRVGEEWCTHLARTQQVMLYL